jgi:hypothetical protein
MEEARFCTECGAKADEMTASKHCACGFNLTDFSARFCPECGTKTSKAPEHIAMCARCGYDMSNSTDDNCTVCGCSEIDAIEAGQADETTPPPLPHQRVLRVFGVLALILGPLIAIVRGIIESALYGEQAMEAMMPNLILIAIVCIIVGLGLIIAAGPDKLPGKERVDRAKKYSRRGLVSLVIFVLICLINVAIFHIYFIFIPWLFLLLTAALTLSTQYGIRCISYSTQAKKIGYEVLPYTLLYGWLAILAPIGIWIWLVLFLLN